MMRVCGAARLPWAFLGTVGSTLKVGRCFWFTLGPVLAARGKTTLESPSLLRG
jgi:hypothetical protein